MTTATAKMTTTTSHAVSRSAELLSCAKTAVKIAQRQGTWNGGDLSLLSLATTTSNNPLHTTLDEGISLLQAMEAELVHLEALVRRRGQTNDPTTDIASSTHRLQTYARELAHWIDLLVPPTARGQRQAHWNMVQTWFRTQAQEHVAKQQALLQTRAQVVASQVQRRQLFASNATTTTAAKSAPHNPLFQVVANKNNKSNAGSSSTPRVGNGSTTQSNGTHSNVTTNGHTPSATTSPYASTTPYGSYGVGTASYGGGGYGGTTGMRQRRTTAATHDSSNQNSTNPQQQQLLLQQRQQERHSQQRLDEARQAESSLAELGNLFGKMSTLIAQQAEVLDKVEDDVEAAMVDVASGGKEIQTVYHIQKGNRPLILKTFLLLNFFIVFMKFYRG